MGNPEAGPNYARLMEEYYSATSAHVPARFQEDDTKGKKYQANDDEKNDGKNNQPNPSAGGKEDSSVGPRRQTYDSNPDKMVQDAHQYYEMYKPILAEGFLSLKDRTASREFFLSRSAKDAFMIIQIELNLIYDAFYTKSFLMFTKRAVARILCFAFVIVSLVLFCWNWDLKKQKTDAILTLILFNGAIALDISAATMFVLSDWWIILADDRKRRSPYLSRIMDNILRCLRCLPCLTCLRGKKRHPKKRWSENTCEYNLLKYCFRKRPCLLKIKWPINIYKIKFVRDMIIELLYVRSKALEEQNDDGLEDFIIEEIRKKAEQAHDPEVAKEVFSARGNLVLEDDYYLVSEYLSPWTTDIDYDESLMIWHLATDICYWRTDTCELSNKEAKKHRRYSKKLSDYMLYLVIWQQSLLSSVVGMSETRFQDTCEEAKKFNDNEEIDISWLGHLGLKAKEWRWRLSPMQVEQKESEFFKRFSDKVLKVKAVIEPMVAKGDKSKSVLFDACRLAKQLEMFGEQRWEIISKVWLELLCYAAVRCSPRYHIAQLSKGGELITLVWLYMAHLGLGERFLKNQGFGSTKLVIEK